MIFEFGFLRIIKQNEHGWKFLLYNLNVRSSIECWGTQLQVEWNVHGQTQVV